MYCLPFSTICFIYCLPFRAIWLFTDFHSVQSKSLLFSIQYNLYLYCFDSVQSGSNYLPFSIIWIFTDHHSVLSGYLLIACSTVWIITETYLSVSLYLDRYCLPFSTVWISTVCQSVSLDLDLYCLPFSTVWISTVCHSVQSGSLLFASQ